MNHRSAVFRLAVAQWKSSYLARAREFLFWRKHKNKWLAGYGRQGPGWRELVFESLIRLLELLGFGLLVLGVEALLVGSRYRKVSPEEWAFAKTCSINLDWEQVWIDERSGLLARPMNIAFVLGPVVKTWSKLHTTLLVHELVHVKQFYHWGWSYVAKALAAQWIGAGYQYRCDLLLHLQASDTNFVIERQTLDRAATYLNAEQEAALLEDLARLRLNQPPRWAR